MLSAFVQNCLNDIEQKATAFAESDATHFPVCSLKDPACEEVRVELEKQGETVEDFEGNLCIVKGTHVDDKGEVIEQGKVQYAPAPDPVDLSVCPDEGTRNLLRTLFAAQSIETKG